MKKGQNPVYKEKRSVSYTHLIAVAPPIGGVAGGQLDGVALDAAGGVQMGTGAQVHELALLIEGDVCLSLIHICLFLLDLVVQMIGSLMIVPVIPELEQIQPQGVGHLSLIHI